ADDNFFRGRAMMKRTMGTIAGLALILTTTLVAQAPAPFKRTLLQQHDLSTPGKEFVQALAEVQPASASGRHTHPGEEVGYVLAGTLVVEPHGQPAATSPTGDALFI